MFKATVIYGIKGYEVRENLKSVQIYDLRTRFKVIFKDIS
jgi:PII-like signaling protein